MKNLILTILVYAVSGAALCAAIRNRPVSTLLYVAAAYLAARASADPAA